MKKTPAIPKSSELYRKIAALPLLPATRDEALGALSIAERLIGAFNRARGAPKRNATLGTPKTA